MKIQLPHGILLNYVERGNPSGLPVVFIHGFPFTHRMWDPQMRALPAGIRAIAYDVRGHGDSQVADGQYTIEFHVDDLLALLDHLVIEKAVVCGLSMGGYIALRAVERNPDRVRALVLADTRSEADTNEARVKRSASIRAVKLEGVPTFAENFAKAVFAPETFTKQPQTIAFIKDLMRSNTMLGISGTLIALAARTDTTPSLSRISVPTLILVGEHDALTPPAAAESLHKHIKDSTLTVIPGAAHMSNVENEAAFNKALIGFLRTL
ncbi:MAG: hypothetical protein A2X67_11460 [Ignavibacteria bacterium GWA2_55_11]|nr:MAG: hypothetical protein A2X67_11460 [Ignavibacteria bacterium GWA2_55_11]OGU46441.1 MAG: hypothetical protein A2X68_04325 [Ignavibacteria bacterium GWC2_56_12]OGU62260.1 MAG: hypothetical protein A3C56_04035 [Ignavibacteria bacterium RIFCSPHIGHO2_02_FULL_56_12]OGU72309.1 MAG: hypothetical protein A3H45_08235 [Ignavibacteria bacterium RIFCSPLOWO2_02_FULL_55_14]OGU75237.1 MAG: hypothetical protein A3G43_05450 [Ignavibacteria bacterium RIFCSPLOWO2_12_FULL_56_21]HAV23326.1 alpha/beta hydrolas